MKAQDLMTRKVHAVKVSTPVSKIVDLMVSMGVSALPVIDRDFQVLGIVTEGDLLRRVEIGTEKPRPWWARLVDDPVDTARDYVKSRGSRARDVMTSPVISVAPATTAAEIADLMEKWNIKRVPVVRAGKLVGIVSRRDLMRAIRNHTAASLKDKAGDGVLRERLRKQLKSVDWVDTSLVNFVVDKGKVEIFGVVPSAVQREAIRVMVETIKGVRSVKDRLSVYSRRLYVA